MAEAEAREEAKRLHMVLYNDDCLQSEILHLIRVICNPFMI